MSDQYVHYLTTDETAQALGVSRRTVARYKSLHKITPIKLNNKDMYSSDEIARFGAYSESEVDKLKKQHMFNSVRIVELEARLAFLESMLNIKSTQDKLNIADVNVDDIKNTLHYLCRLRLDKWSTAKVEDLSKDVGRMSDRLIKKVGADTKTALEMAYLFASKSTDSRACIAAAMSKTQLDRVISVLG